MSEGEKDDKEKVRLDLLSPLWIFEVGQVMTFGAKKYTRYGECDCVLNLNAANLKYKPEDFVKTITTSGLKQPTRHTDNVSPITATRGKKEIIYTLESIIEGVTEILLPKGTNFPEKKSTQSLMEDANYAVKQLAVALTMITKLDESVDAFASRVMSESDGLKKESGSKKHENTCASLKIQQTGENNWRHGIARSRLLAACLRHVFSYLGGEDNDPETGLSHLAHASCCLQFALELHYTRPSTDDRYKLKIKEEKKRMKLETNLLIGADTKKWLADFTLQLDRFEKLSGQNPLASSQSKDDIDDEEKCKDDKGHEETVDDDDFTPAKAAKPAKKSTVASFDDDAEPETEDEHEEPGHTKRGRPKKITLEDVNAAAKDRALRTTRAEVLGILKKQFKVKSISELDEEQYGAVVRALK